MNQDLSRRLFVGIGGGDCLCLDVAEIVGIGFKIAKKTRGLFTGLSFPRVTYAHDVPTYPYL